ncbi:MAG: hypothetical protein MJK04_03330 [Psychrosphaera sp.]|nr:hypothetical protein [Psychrosphaera sp.]
MIILGVAGVSLLIIFYLYIRSEGLRRELHAYRRQVTNLSSDSKHMEDTVEALAFEQQVALGKRLTRTKQFGHPDVNRIKFTEAMVDAIVNVTVESAKGHKNTVESFKKQLAKKTDISFNDFNDFISNQDDKIKSEWHKKSIAGYLNICAQLIENLNNDVNGEN